ncbi:transcription factor AP-4-like [Pollicipes pollicipes]|uniref:transcription factor AP-4-like n=1 Tax=Pollicipes pollicipes TaxID=41117 RepID=UPI001884D242|nr:transcription factor AP-4-like [Pollicipes pollicipes]
MRPTSGGERTVGEIPDSRDEEVAGILGSLQEAGAQAVSPRSAMEQEKRFRREIANSNERRRMESINSGFQTLRALLPQREGEKLSKAAILQQTSDFIYSLEQEKARLLTQNCQLKRLLGQQQQQGADSDAAADSPASARRSVSQESEGDELARPSSTGATSPPQESLRRQLLELRAQLEQEQRQRGVLEERLHLAEQQQQQRPSSPPPLPATTLAPGYADQLSPPPRLPHQVHRRFKRSRLEEEEEADELPRQTVLPALLTPEQKLAPPPPPPVVTHRPLYAGSTMSRQNLDTIVEAIRHLEGDHLFRDLPEPTPRLEPCLEQEPQEAPLELTTHARAAVAAADSYRPGVIVVQHQHQMPS